MSRSSRLRIASPHESIQSSQPGSLSLGEYSWKTRSSFSAAVSPSATVDAKRARSDSDAKRSASANSAPFDSKW